MENKNHETMYCDECKFIMKTKEIEVKEKTFIEKGVSVTIQYFTCPNCNHNFLIRIDDQRSRELQRECNEIIARLERGRKKHQVPKQKTLESLSKKKRKLYFWVGKNMKKYKHLTEGL